MLGRALRWLWNSGSALIAIAAFLFSFTALSVKQLCACVPAFEVTFTSSLICWLLTSIALYVTRTPPLTGSSRVITLTLLRGILGAAALMMYYIAIELLPLKDAVTLFFSSPVVAALMEVVVMGPAARSLGTASALGSVFTVSGVVLVSQPSFLHIPGQPVQPRSHAQVLGMSLATGAAIANAAAFVIVRLLEGAQPALALTWWHHLAVVAVSAGPMAAGFPAPAIMPAAKDVWLILAIASTQAVAQVLLNRGFQLETATRGSAINCLQVLFSYGWDILFLHDRAMGLTSAAGSLCVVAGVLCSALATTRSGSSQGGGNKSGRLTTCAGDTANDSDGDSQGDGSDDTMQYVACDVEGVVGGSSGRHSGSGSGAGAGGKARDSRDFGVCGAAAILPIVHYDPDAVPHRHQHGHGDAVLQPEEAVPLHEPHGLHAHRRGSRVGASKHSSRSPPPPFGTTSEGVVTHGSVQGKTGLSRPLLSSPPSPNRVSGNGIQDQAGDGVG